MEYRAGEKGLEEMGEGACGGLWEQIEVIPPQAVYIEQASSSQTALSPLGFGTFTNKCGDPCSTLCYQQGINLY